METGIPLTEHKLQVYILSCTNIHLYEIRGFDTGDCEECRLLG
jgi:hypothetical protein